MVLLRENTNVNKYVFLFGAVLFIIKLIYNYIFCLFYDDLLLWVLSCLIHNNFYEVHITIFLCRNVLLLYIIRCKYSISIYQTYKSKIYSYLLYFVSRIFFLVNICLVLL